MSLAEILLVIGFLAISSFLSLSEIALVGISKLRLRHRVDRGVPGARIVQGLVAQMDQVIATILVWSNFINAALTSLVTAACVIAWGERMGVVVSSLLSGTLILLLTDIIPKVYAARHADQVSLGVAPAMRVLVNLFQPVAQGMIRLTHWFFRKVGLPMQARSPLVTEEELKLMIEMGKEEGVLGEHERRMLQRIFEFGDLKVSDVMVPRDQMVAIPEGAAHDEVLTVFTEQGHSRIPVWRDSPDRIIGTLHAQEILHIWREGWLIVLQDLIHPPFEVAPQMRVTELLQEFQRRKVQIAIVVDSQGKGLGLVTLEDLLEEIVGNIA